MTKQEVLTLRNPKSPSIRYGPAHRRQSAARCPSWDTVSRHFQCGLDKPNLSHSFSKGARRPSPLPWLLSLQQVRTAEEKLHGDRSTRPDLEVQSPLDTERKVSLEIPEKALHWSTPQMFPTPGAGPGRSQKPGAPSWSHTCVAGSQVCEPSRQSARMR